MMTRWEKTRKILCVRPDNMGDLLMSSPAITALKETFNCDITLLTSSMAKGMARHLPAVDECIVWDVPWVKGTPDVDAMEFWDLTKKLSAENFDAAVIFSVFSQNPLPTALLLTLAGVPRRLAYCRENPYHLLTDWVPEEEPYKYIRHQVRRDLDLVAAVGAKVADERIRLTRSVEKQHIMEKLKNAGVNEARPWLILHPGVSEKKREYPVPLWIEAGKRIAAALGYQLLITGAKKENKLAGEIAAGIGPSAFNFAGALSLEEFIDLIKLAPLVISVNTATTHVASAVQTKVIVLYALTNPQHAPWKTIGKVLPYSVPPELQSSNEVLRYIQDEYVGPERFAVSPDAILEACYELLVEGKKPLIEEVVVPFKQDEVHGRRKALNFREP